MKLALQTGPVEFSRKKNKICENNPSS